MEETTPPSGSRRDADAARRPAPTLVSIVIAARNAETTIGDQLAAIAGQTYGGRFDVVLCDNRSSDSTVACAQAWSDRLALRIVHANERANANYARNAGARAARGELLVFTDADDRVADGWLAALVESALAHDLVGGRLDASALNDPAVVGWRPPLASGPSVAGNFLAFAPGNSLAIWAEVFATLGFAEHYDRQQDIELSWRAQVHGYRLGFAPNALVHYRYRSTFRGLARQAYGTGVAAAQLYRDFRPHGMPRASVRDALRTYLWLTLRVADLARPAHRARWIRLAASVAGRAVGSVRFRVLYL